MAISRPSFNFRTKQIVYSDTGESPYVGFEHLTDQPDGWLYNIKRWCSLFDLRLPHLPRLVDPSTQGVNESVYFKSGVGSKDVGDLAQDRIDELFRNNERHWVPVLRHGHYFRYKTPWFLYGDNSRIEYVDSANNRDGRNYLELDAEPDMSSPILAATFRRHLTSRTPVYDTYVNQVAEFTGIYVGGAEQETVSEVGKVDWDNVDFTKKEFIVDNSTEGITAIKFNRDFTQTHGIVPVVFQDLAACELLGWSNGGNYQIYYLGHFPVLADSSFHLYVADVSTWEEWERVDTWFELINLTNSYSVNNKKYFLDKDLGIIYFGSSVTGGAPPLGSFVLATYTSTVRVEYEEADRSMKVSAWDADVNPLSQHINQGFVVITHDSLEAAQITLTIDKPPIAFTNNPVEHGPVIVGSDYAILRADVTTIDGVAVPGVEVGFQLSPSDAGFLQGGTQAVSVTNGLGHAYASYQPPVSADTLGFYTVTIRASTHPSYSSGYKELILNTTQSGLAGKESEVYLYQVLKDDIALAYDSVDDFIYQTLETPAWVVDATTYARWKSEITEEYDLKDWFTINTADGIKEDGTQDGRKVVVYQINSTTDNYDATALDPVKGTAGAIVPVRPTYIEQIDDASDVYNGLCRVIYPEDALPDCNPTDSNNNIGGYWVVSSRLVNFQAHCQSPYYNRTIYSNELTARVTLPSYLKGEYITPLIQKVPFGWKFPTDTDNIAAGMDGATFITINPHAAPYPNNDILWGPYNVLDLVNSTTSDDWASAPFMSIGFQFELPYKAQGFQFYLLVP